MPSATHVSGDGHDSVSLAPWQTVVVVVEQWNFVVQIFTPPAHSPVWLAHASPTSGRLPSSIRPLQSLSLPSQISTPPFVGTHAAPAAPGRRATSHRHRRCYSHHRRP